MRDALIIYATKHGHTRKVAGAIAETLRKEAMRVGVHDIADGEGPAPGEYDLVIVGASVHAGGHQREIVDWAKHHSIALNAMPSAFFSVCLTAAEESDESRAATRKYLDDFADDTGWTPRKATAIAGALEYREYDFVTRMLMRLLMQRGGHPTDWSRDYVYTDWDAVERFARECAAMEPVVGTDPMRV